MTKPTSEQFTQRMLELCEEAPRRCPGYYPTRFRQMVEGCGGDFVPVAKKMLRSGDGQSGLKRLADAGAADSSMEAVILQEPWRTLFNEEDLGLAQWRLDQVRR